MIKELETEILECKEFFSFSPLGIGYLLGSLGVQIIDFSHLGIMVTDLRR